MITVFGAAFNPDEVVGRAHALYGIIEKELASKNWLAAHHATIADIAIYSYTARAPEGNVDLAAYPNVLSWLERIESLPGFVDFVKTPVGLAA